ncbi:thisbe [Anaeramoeba flamelloides]|uniref:Thisbe n=1 Tax=Anaeramoeba flamelloides TaxID=1746091 RepID=A0AAV7ZYH9_9EUKA|nr:thisbe [Anaeramoeba flamelloides]
MILKPSQIEDCERNQTIKNKSKNNTKNTLLNNFTLFNKSPPQIQNKRIQLVKIKNRQIRLQQKLIKRDLLRIKSLLLCNLKLKSKVTFHADLTLTEYLKWLYNQENLINVKEWFRDTIEIYSVYWKYVISFTLILSLFYCVLWFSIFNIYQVIVLKNNSKSPFPNDENQCVLNTKLFSYQKLILFDNSLEAKLSILLLPQAKSYLKSILANLKADKLSNYLSHLLLNPNQIQSNIKDQNRFNNKASHDLIYNNNNNNVINNNNNININNNMNTINSTNNKNVLYQKKKSEFLNQMDNCSFKSVHLILLFLKNKKIKIKKKNKEKEVHRNPLQM